MDKEVGEEEKEEEKEVVGEEEEEVGREEEEEETEGIEVNTFLSFTCIHRIMSYEYM